MENNPYTPPTARLDESTSKSQEFYVVSIPKFSILFFSTLGIYGIYWFYANWKQYKQVSGESIWPAPRALFNIFFTHSLFTKIQDSLDKEGITFAWNPSITATIYVILAILSNILDRLSINEVGTPYTDTLSLLALPAIYYTLLIPQKAVNIGANDPGGSINSSYSAANYLWIGAGALLWLLTIVGFLAIFGIISE